MESGSPNADRALVESKACVAYIDVATTPNVGASVRAQGYVEFAICVVIERSIPRGGVVPADSVAKERLRTHGCVAIASDVGCKGSLPQGHVEAACGVADKGIFTYRRVVAAAGIAQECLTIHGSVDTPIGVRLERTKAESRVEGARAKA